MIMINKNNILSKDRKPHNVNVEIKMSVPTMNKMTNTPIITKYIGNRLKKFFEEYDKHLKSAKENVINKTWLTFFGKLKFVCHIDPEFLRPKSIVIAINEDDIDEAFCLKGMVAGFTIYY